MKHSETETCRHRKTRERDRQRDRCCRTEKKQLKAPVDSACQQCCNCRLMVDSPGGKTMAGGREGRRRNVAEIRR